MRQFRLQVRLKNNRLVKLREDLAMTVAAFARAVGVAEGMVYRLESFKISPWSKTTEAWTPAAQRIADFHGVSPEWIWSEEVKLVRKSAMLLEVSGEQLKELANPHDELEREQLVGHMKYLMTALTPGEARVVRETIVEEKTLKEVGTTCGRSQEWARKIRERGLTKIRREMDRLSKSRRTRALAASGLIPIVKTTPVIRLVGSSGLALTRCRDCGKVATHEVFSDEHLVFEGCFKHARQKSQAMGVVEVKGQTDTKARYMRKE